MGRPPRSAACGSERSRGAILMNWGRAPTTLTSLVAGLIELRDRPHHVPLLVRRQLGIDGERERLLGGPHGHGAVLGFPAQRGEALLQVERDRVVDLGADLGPAEVLPEVVPPLRPDDVLVEDVAIARRHPRRPKAIGEARLLERRLVDAGVRLATSRPPVEVLELDEQDRGLHLVEAEVAADDEMVVLGLAAVDSQDLQALRQCGIVGHAHPRIAERAQVLAWEEGEAADVTDAAGPTAPRILSTDGLGR